MFLRKRLYWLIGVMAVSTTGFFVIPPLIKKLSSYLYNSTPRKDEIDFDNLGPEIVKKNVETEGEKEHDN